MGKLNPKIDLVFKKLFGSKQNADILKAFINAVLSEDQQIETIHIKNPYNLESYKEVDDFILDIKAQDQHGGWYNIVIQMAINNIYAKRTLYYWAKSYTDQPNTTSINGILNKTIVINVLEFEFMTREPDYHNVFQLLHEKSKTELPNIIELHFLELSKYDIKHSNPRNALDRWVTFLLEGPTYSTTKIPEKLQNDQEVLKALIKLDELSTTSEEYEIYEAQLKNYRDWIEQLKTAYEEGFARSFAQSFTESMGQVEGLYEAQKEIALEIARSLIGLIDVEIIAQKTGISVDEVEALTQS